MKKKIVAGMIIGSVAALAVVGLVFLWWCPQPQDAVKALGDHWAFGRQLVWNAVGVTACCGMLLLEWNRLLKAAPFVLAGWLAMDYVAAHYMPMVNGSLCLRYGPFALYVMSCLPFVFALMLAWVAERLKFRAVPFLFRAAVAMTVSMTAIIATNHNRVERIRMFFRGETPNAVQAERDPDVLARYYCLERQSAAIKTAQWFGAGDAETLKLVPGKHTHSMPVASAVMFGKWFPTVVLMLFAVFAAGLLFAWRGVSSEAQKVFVFVAGLGVVLPTIQGFGECFNLMPMCFIDVPLVSFNGTQALMAWLTAGAILSCKASADR